MLHASHMMVLSMFVMTTQASQLCNTNEWEHEAVISANRSHFHCFEVKYTINKEKCLLRSYRKGFSFARTHECQISAGSVVCTCANYCEENDNSNIENSIRANLISLAQENAWKINCLKELLHLREKHTLKKRFLLSGSVYAKSDDEVKEVAISHPANMLNGIKKLEHWRQRREANDDSDGPVDQNASITSSPETTSATQVSTTAEKTTQTTEKPENRIETATVITTSAKTSTTAESSTTPLKTSTSIELSTTPSTILTTTTSTTSTTPSTTSITTKSTTSTAPSTTSTTTKTSTVTTLTTTSFKTLTTIKLSATAMKSLEKSTISMTTTAIPSTSGKKSIAPIIKSSKNTSTKDVTTIPPILSQHRNVTESRTFNATTVDSVGEEAAEEALAQVPARAEPWLPVYHSSVFALQKKSRKGDVKNLVLLTYLRAFTVIGVMAVVLFLQLCLIHCMMVRRREAYENIESAQEPAPLADKSREKIPDKSREKTSDKSKEKANETKKISWFRRFFKRKKEKDEPVVKRDKVKKEVEEKRLPNEPLVPYHAPFQLLSPAELAPTQMSNVHPAPTLAPLKSAAKASSPPTDDLFMTPGDAKRPPLPKASSPGRSANHDKKGLEKKAKKRNDGTKSSYGWEWM